MRHNACLSRMIRSLSPPDVILKARRAFRNSALQCTPSDWSSHALFELRSQTCDFDLDRASLGVCRRSFLSREFHHLSIEINREGALTGGPPIAQVSRSAVVWRYPRLISKDAPFASPHSPIQSANHCQESRLCAVPCSAHRRCCRRKRRTPARSCNCCLSRGG